MARRKTQFDALRERITPPGLGPSLEEVNRDLRVWGNEFFDLMKNRLRMGALRYGGLNDPDKPTYPLAKDIRERLLKYEETGNRELLVDIANFALCEFVEGEHPKRHFKAHDREE